MEGCVRGCLRRNEECDGTQIHRVHGSVPFYFPNLGCVAGLGLTHTRVNSVTGLCQGPRSRGAETTRSSGDNNDVLHGLCSCSIQFGVAKSRALLTDSRPRAFVLHQEASGKAAIGAKNLAVDPPTVWANQKYHHVATVLRQPPPFNTINFLHFLN